jgi:hypothetical protein
MTPLLSPPAIKDPLPKAAARFLRWWDKLTAKQKMDWATRKWSPLYRRRK